MTRKDTILIAVIINAGLLSVLFATAVIYDTNKGVDQAEEGIQISSVPPVSNTAVASAAGGDEVDNVLSYYANPSQPIEVEINSDSYSVLPSEVSKEASSPTSATASYAKEVVVKKGDVLEKIARANGTTVESIKQINQLKSERLQIGQVLKIIHEESPKVATPVKPVPTEQSEIVYYVVKSGDSPWKIAKQNGVKYEDILRLNGLNEEKARNLKIGDKIRIK
jgi:LysM repeat protein